MKYLISTVIIVLVALAFFILKNKELSETKTISKIDTIIIEKPSKPIEIKSKPKIVIIKDTIIMREPFIARLDTVIERDTVFAEYKFPDDSLKLLIRRRPDSLVYRTITIEKEKNRAWHEIPGAIGIGAIIGGVFGFIIGSK